jgi:tetratricopeptide (TPR) repeat protein
VVECAADNLAALPADWAHEYLGMAAPPSIVSRAWLIMSLAELGRFSEAAKYDAEAIRLAESTDHAFTIGWAHFAASMLQLARHNWAKARSQTERWIALLQAGNIAIHLPWAVASSAWALAQIGETSEALNRVREAERLLERQASTGIVAHRGWAYHAMGRACLLLNRLDEARRLGDRAVESSRGQPGFAAHALHLLGDVAIHPDWFDRESGAAFYQEALALAHTHGMRPLVAHCHLGFAKLHRYAGNPEHAGDNLSAAITMYREMDMAFGFEPEEALPQ